MHEHGSGLLPPWGEEKEVPGQGELFSLWHPETEGIFSGYGLVAEEEFKGYLVGIPMANHLTRRKGTNEGAF